jgi:hypothetical protein
MGIRRHGEVREASCKPRHSQDAHGVLAEGVCHVAQHAGVQVGHAAVGVYQCVQIWLLIF